MKNNRHAFIKDSAWNALAYSKNGILVCLASTWNTGPTELSTGTVPDVCREHPSVNVAMNYATYFRDINHNDDKGPILCWLWSDSFMADLYPIFVDH